MSTKTLATNCAAAPGSAHKRPEQPEAIEMSQIAQGAVARPPTLRGRNASPQLLEAASRIARRAVDDQLGNLGFQDAVSALLSTRPRRAALELAHDHLAFTRLQVPLTAQTDALFVIDAALHRLEHPDRSRGQESRECDRRHHGIRFWFDPSGEQFRCSGRSTNAAGATRVGPTAGRRPGPARKVRRA